MAADKKCPNCGACKECGAAPAKLVPYAPYYPWRTWPHINPYAPNTAPYGRPTWTVTGTGTTTWNNASSSGLH